MSQLSALLDKAVEGYGNSKAYAGDLTGASEELLHVHAGLLIFVAAALVLRKRVGSAVPLVLVVAFAVLNEIADALSGGPQPAFEPVADFANTVFWPAILFLLARRWRG